MDVRKVEVPVVAVMELPATALKVYVAAILLTGGKPTQVSARQLALVSGMSERTVRRWLPWLVDEGWLERYGRSLGTGQADSSLLVVR